MTLHLRIDPIACTGHGMCAELFPELIQLDDWGYPIVQNEGVVPAQLEEHAERAAQFCPTIAVLLERKHEHARPQRPPRPQRPARPGVQRRPQQAVAPRHKR